MNRKKEFETKKIFALSSTKVVVIVANYLTVSYNTVSA